MGIYPNHVPEYFKEAYTGIIQDLVDPAGITKSSYYVAKKINGDWTTIPNYSSYIDMCSNMDLTVIENIALDSSNMFDWAQNLIIYYPFEESHLVSSFHFWSNNQY